MVAAVIVLLGAGGVAAAATPPAALRAPSSTKSIKDCAACPDMVVIPAGVFTMGSPQQEGGESQHRVTIAYAFALGRAEVTFDQWDACVSDGGCNGYRPSDSGWGRGTRPVVNVSWNDSEAYVRWVSKKTGKPYRLPSEAEWEYAARAGTETPFYFGTAISSDMANYDGTYAFGAKAGIYRRKTLPVASFKPNVFGLYDMLGNAWEWTEDCWHDDYTTAAPNDGSAWKGGDCSLHVRRGGSWANYPWIVRSAFRNGNYAGARYNTYGFRVARTL